MSTQTYERDLRRFTQAEFDTMLHVGLLTQRERATLVGGTVMVPDNRLAPLFPPRRTSLELDKGTVPSDQVVAEAPASHRLQAEKDDIMNMRATTAPRPPVRRKFTVAEYYRMTEVGIPSPDERVELLGRGDFRHGPYG